MFRILPVILCNIHCPNYSLGSLSALFVCKEMYRSNDGKFVKKGSFAAIAEWLKPEQFTSSGRCRTPLTPT